VEGENMKKREAFKFVLGVAIGYGFVHGLSYFQSHYLWTVFYR
jgi:hypothetical protein